MQTGSDDVVHMILGVATGSEGVTRGSEGSVVLGLTVSVSGESSLEMDPGLLEGSVLTEQQKLRHVLDWAKNFLGTSQDGHNLSRTSPSSPHLHSTSAAHRFEVGGRAAVSPRGTFHNLVRSRNVRENMVGQSEPLTRLPYTTPLPCHTLSHTPGGREFSGPEFKENPGHKELVLFSGPQEDNNDQPRFLGVDNPQADQTPHKPIAPHPEGRDGVSISESLRDRDSSITNCCSSVDSDTILWLPGYGPLSRAHDLISRERGCVEREDRVLGMQEHKEEKAVAEEDPKTGLEGTSSIIPYGSSRVALEGEHLDWGANGWVSEGLSVYEEYLLCVSRLDHLRTEQNQAPADVMTRPADVMTLPADVMTRPADVMTLPADVMTLPADVMTLPADVMTRPADVMTLPADVMTLPADVMTRPADVMTLPADVMTLPADVMTLPADVMTRPADVMTLPADQMADPSEQPHVHQDIHNEGRRAPFKSSEVNNSRVMQPKSSGGQPGVRSQACVRGRGRSWRFWERSSLSWSSFTHGEVLPRSQLPNRPHSAGVLSCSGLRPPTTLQLPLGSAVNTNATNIAVTRALKLAPVGGCVQWLSLPDEVWVSILSLLPHRDLSTVAQVCLHLLRLANDHTLWQVVSVENSSSLTDRWLRSVGVRNPRSLTIYRCSGLSITPSGLEEFFKLSQASLEVLSVTSCNGPGLHGDLVLTLSGQHCDHMTCVDVSWSGATDTGIKALTDTCTGLKVSDQTVHQVLLQCPELQRLTLSSCPGVTDMSLHKISTHAPHIRLLDLSGCGKVSDAGVKAVAVACRCLQYLDLSSTATGNRGVSLLAKYCSTHLHTVKLSFCQISPEAIHNLSRQCKRVSLLAKYCSTHLHTVKLSFCQISPEAIHNLSRQCKRLKLLHLYGCAYIPTEKEIRDINTTLTLNPLT
ncbi:uncharacterized protein LOC118370867 [Oncorhynchus keta]|uniref:uncharacterized protein LOC118370867 n=1 Tax=Oncorhynchus keta TaxID=8018 RepID=UPI00227B4CD4|nr:uncharacterized protein LOC118370867 [Oncorhynchus keta]